ncbi:hypothetical protein SRHO_G00079630 [Serrasalmus rhombeus]
MITSFSERYVTTDMNVNSVMTDEELGVYFPKYGDHIAVRAFCHQKMAACSSTGRGSSSKSSILQRLKAKLKKSGKGCDQCVSDRSSAFGNKYASKDNRRLEMGWLHFQEGQYRQVSYHRKPHCVRYMKKANFEWSRLYLCSKAVNAEEGPSFVISSDTDSDFHPDESTEKKRKVCPVKRKSKPERERCVQENEKLDGHVYKARRHGGVVGSAVASQQGGLGFDSPAG